METRPAMHVAHLSNTDSPTRYNMRLRASLCPEPWAAWKEIMPTDIIMPQMGESIVEGTITKWLKKPGDKVQRDEPLFEISTDKVDAEIPAPASGVLQEIKVSEGTTVGVNTVVGTIAWMAKPQPRRRKPRPHPRRLRKRGKRRSRLQHQLPHKLPALRLHNRRQTKEQRKPAPPHWSVRSPANTVSIFRKLPAPDSAAVSPSRTSWPSSSTRRQLLLRRRFRSRQRQHPPNRGPQHYPRQSPIPAIWSR